MTIQNQKQLPKGWKWVRLGEIVVDVIDNRGGNAPYYTTKGIPVIDNFMITSQGKVHVNLAKRFIDEHIFRTFIRKYIRYGDVLITLVGNGYGNVALVPKKKAVIIQNTIGIRTRKLVTNIFLYYWLRTNRKLLQNLDRGAVQPSIHVGDIKNLQIPLPPLPEQKAIAEVLSSLDDKIELLQEQNKTLEEMAQTLFRKWFIDNPERKKWKKVRLGEVVDIAIGRTPPRKESKWFSKDSTDWKWISIKDMGASGVYIFRTSEYLTNKALEKFNIPIIPTNTVVLSFKMTVGRVKITAEEMLSNEAIAHFKFVEQTLFTTEYLYLFLKTFNFNSFGSTSSIVTSINSRLIKGIMVEIPNKETMDKFEKVNKFLFNKIYINQFQIRTLRGLRDTLLPKLTSGEVRVKL